MLAAGETTHYGNVGKYASLLSRRANIVSLFRISSTGALSTITGGSQPLPEDFDVYGTCVYHRRRDNRFFLFANSKKATYLQFELTSNSSSLQTKLVRKFQIGTGTQPEGCVVDDDNEIIFIGEEQVGLWKYDANPERETGTGTLVDSIDRASGGRMDADVEGVALVYGTTVSQGFIIVSMQGVSSYNVYKREAPHEFVLRFTIGASKNRGVDGVTNTDGVAAVGTSLGGSFAQGLIVVHDDANELSSGGTSPDASFKLVSLADV
jgi:3-phytase